MQEVKIIQESGVVNGILLNEDTEYYTVKLSSGYNISIKKSKVQSIVKGKKILNPKNKTTSKKGLYTILHTGGTIASKIDYNTGSVIAQVSAEEILNSIPELKKIASFSSIQVSNIMSECITFKHYNIIIKAIEKEINSGTKGIIVTHGTDFLHVTSAAISFALENINIPVVFVGSQRSSDRPSSDAAMNVICAAHFLKENIPGVYVCMHSSSNDDSCLIHKGTNVRKMHTSRRDAFQSINSLPLANIFPNGKIQYFLDKPVMLGKTKITYYKELKIGLIKTRPNMFAKEFTFFKDYDALLIEGSGIGNAPVMSFDEESQEAELIFQEIKKLKIPLALTSQTIHGRINMNVYSVSRKLLDIGVMGNNLDMTTETAYVKLAWIMSNNPQKVNEIYEQNLRGEISERSKKHDY